VADPIRIAMWSGPRNLSTALMRSFSSRADCWVVDEPFYAAYLDKTGLDHPMRQDVLKGERDGNVVAQTLGRSAQNQAPVFYQKHMLQHMIDGMPRGWMKDVQNVFLIRDPARVLASYQAKREDVSLDDLGIRQQIEMFEDTDAPIIVDAADILANPPEMLSRLCKAIEIPFDPAMLSWPEGPHPADGVWGKHWYGQIWKSRGFSSPDESPRPEVTRPEIMGPAMEIYEAMHAVRLK